ncbi:hypothetical protein, partial [Kingella oralis]
MERQRLIVKMLNQASHANISPNRFQAASSPTPSQPATNLPLFIPLPTLRRHRRKPAHQQQQH